MKKVTFTTLLSLLCGFSFGQTVPYSSLHEDFNSSCGGTSPGLPLYWHVYTPVGSMTMGDWQCTATGGRPTTTSAPTAGVTCTGTYSSTFNLDTSYLLTPKLQLPIGATDVYFQFDAKSVPVSPDLEVYFDTSSVFDTANPGLNVSGMLVPPIGAADSVWVTHQLNLTPFLGMGPFYIAFRYGSGTTSGVIWYLDNVNTASTSITLSSKQPQQQKVFLGVTESSPSEVGIFYDAPETGSYDLCLYDVFGRVVSRGATDAGAGRNTYTFSGLHLADGMYFVRVSGNGSAGTAKVMIR